MPASFWGADLQHCLAVGFLQALQLPLVLLAHILGLGSQRVFHTMLAILHPAFDLRRCQLELPTGSGPRRLSLDDLKDQHRLSPAGPALDLFFHHFAHRRLPWESKT